jgi:hypothetical protein
MNFQHFIKPGRPKPRLQRPTICPYSDPDQSCPCHHTISCRSILILSTPALISPKWYFSTGFPTEPCTHLSSPPQCHVASPSYIIIPSRYKTSHTTTYPSSMANLSRGHTILTSSELTWHEDSVSTALDTQQNVTIKSVQYVSNWLLNDSTHCYKWKRTCCEHATTLQKLTPR